MEEHDRLALIRKMHQLRRASNQEPEHKCVALPDQAASQTACFRTSADLDQEGLRRFLHEVYPVTAFRGRRVTRLEEKVLGSFDLDADLSLYLGTENLGIFVGGCGEIWSIFQFLRGLSQLTVGGTWVIVAYSHDLAAKLFQEWPSTSHAMGRSEKTPPYWAIKQMVFSTPEKLRHIPWEMTGQPSRIAAIILLDLPCCLHRARGFAEQEEYAGNDRPQLIANCRSRLANGPWSPPLFILTQKPAKSINTVAMHSPYCLEGFWFVLGKSLQCLVEDPTDDDQRIVD